MKGGKPLLGRESSVALGIVSLINGVQSYPQLLKGVGKMPLLYKINLELDA